MTQHIGQRTVYSIAWNIGASVIQIGVGLFRLIFLGRLLPTNIFGIFAWATAVISISSFVANFGLGSAFLHRSPETENEEQAAAVYFTLKMGLILIWLLVMVILASVLTSIMGVDNQDYYRTALIVLAMCEVGLTFADTHRSILTRRIMHKRIAMAQVGGDIFSTIVMILLALQGATLWALLGGAITKVIVDFVVFLMWKPVWHIRFGWSKPIFNYYIRFGSRAMTARILQEALDRVDDLWTGIFLGSTALGFYSYAYNFAVYPRSILATPIYLVAAGTYAELKGKREQLSKAFTQTNGLLIRSSFFLGGLIALSAPEFIRLGPGERWLPMLDAFRLMLVFTLFDPLMVTTSTLFIAVGKPAIVVRVRSTQLGVMVIGLFALGPTLGIAGVALAVDVMLVTGIAILLFQARKYVDLSFKQLFLVPLIALIISTPLAIVISNLPGIVGSDWRTLLFKATVFSGVYILTLLILEWQEINELRLLLSKYFLRQSKV
jgi:O-antigen/teichoic acid export membrane protein